MSELQNNQPALRSLENGRKTLMMMMMMMISHPSKVMLRVIFNRLVNQGELILEEEQAGFRSQKSTTEQIFNLRLLVEKYLEHQKELFHNFIDFKNASDRVWHDGLWQVLKEYNINNWLT